MNDVTNNPTVLDIQNAGTGLSILVDQGDVRFDDGVTLGDAAADVLTANGTWAGASPFTFEGATADGFESTFAITDPTADNTITFQDGSGTVAFTSDIPAAGANTALSNLAAVAINTSLLSDTTNTDDLGSDAINWRNLYLGTSTIYEGATADGFETTISVTDPTADRTITVPNVTGTLVTTGDTGSVTGTMISDGSVDISDDTNLVAGTNISLAGDTLNVDDAFLLNTGDTGTGDYDFTGAVLQGLNALVFEGATADAFETIFAFTDPTADNTITFQDASGTIAFTSDIPGGAGLWETGAFSTYEDDDDVVIGTSGGETIANAGFSLSGDDLFVAGMAGVEGNIYTDGALDVAGATTLGSNVDITLTGTENMLVKSTPGEDNGVSALQIRLTNQDTDAVGINSSQTGLMISNWPDATVATTEYLIYLANSDTDTVLDGIYYDATGPITDAIDASDSDIVNALNVGANVITGTTPTIDTTGTLSINTTNNQAVNFGTGLVTAGGALTSTGTLTANGNTFIGSDSADTLTVAAVLQGLNALVFEGATADAFESTFAFTDPTADRTITFQDASGTVAFTSDIPAAGANTALSNLAAVAINTSLLSDTTNTDDLGSDAINWRNLYLGTSTIYEGATDDGFETTISVTDPTADRTITIPDGSGTLAFTGDPGAGYLLDTGDTGTGDYNFTGAVMQGGSPLVFEGATADAYESTFAFTDPTADRTITFQDASGTVAYTSDILTPSLPDNTTDAYDLQEGTNNYINIDTTNSAESITFGTAAINPNMVFHSSLAAFSDNFSVAGWTQLASGQIDGNFTIGDAVTDTLTVTSVLQGLNALAFEGATADAYETTFAFTDPTADRTITFQNASGTVAFTSDIPAGSSLWEAGTNGTYEDDAAVIVGIDQAETLANAGFTLAAGDLFVQDQLGVEGTIFTDSGLTVGASTTYADGSITTSSATSGFDINVSAAAGSVDVTLGGAAGDDFTVDGTTLVVESDNNRVGIGTAAPNAILQTMQTSGGSHVTGLQLTNTSTTNNSGAQIDFNISGDNTFIGASIGAERVDAEGDGELYFMTRQDPGSSNLERMRIDRFGNIGIGVTDPLARMEIQVNNTDNDVGLLLDMDDTTNNPDVLVINNAGTGHSLIVDEGTARFDDNVILGNAAADILAANGTWSGANPFTFEGATADTNETTISVADPTADRTIILPNASGTFAVSATGPVTLSAAGDIGFDQTANFTWTGIHDYTGATYAGVSPLVFEGATADGFETTFLITDPTVSDKTITFQNGTGTVAFLSDIGVGGLWEDGTNGVYEDDKGVIVGIDQAETLANAGFTLAAGDLFVQDQLGVEGNIYTDGTINVGAATVLSSGKLETTSGDLTIETVSGGDLIIDQATASSNTQLTGNWNIADSSKFQIAGDLFTSGNDNQYMVGIDTTVSSALNAGIDKGGILIDIDGNAADDAASFVDALKVTSGVASGGTMTGVRVAGTLWDQGIYVEGGSTYGLFVDAGNVRFDDGVILGDAAADILTANGTWSGVNPFVFEGATADAYETTFVITDPTLSDKTITFQNATGTVAYLTDIPAAGANTALSNLASVAINTSLLSDTTNTDDLGSDSFNWRNLFLGGTVIFEGSTDNTYETTLTVVDPTADNIITIPNVTGTLVTTGDTGTVTGTMIQNDTVALTTDTTGNYVASITNGNGISGGDGGSEGAALTLSLGPLTADWNQTGAYDIVLNNASSELKILESAGDTYFGTFDVGDLTANRTYTFPDATGTVALTSDIPGGSSLWESGAFATYEDDDDVVVGTSGNETIDNTGFAMDGNDFFVAGMAGVEGNVYTDGSFIAGSSGALLLNEAYIRDIDSDINLQPDNDQDDYIRFSTGTEAGTEVVTAMYWVGIGLVPYTNHPGISVDDTGKLVYRDENSASWVAFDALSGSGLWENGTYGVYEDDEGVIVGADGDETLNNAGFSLTIGDMFISDQLGVEGSIFTDNVLNIDRAEDVAFLTLNDTTNTDTVSIYTGTGTPNGSLVAQAGSIFMDQAGGLYVNSDGGTSWANATSGGGWADDGTVVRLQTATDQVGIGTASPLAGSKLNVAIDDATTSEVTNVAVLDHTTSGTASNGIGAGLLFRTEDNAGQTENAARISGILTNATSTNETSAIAFRTRNAGAVLAETGRFSGGEGLLVGGTAETLDNSGFSMSGDDLFVAGMAGIEGNVYTDGSFIAGASLELNDGYIRDTNADIFLQPDNDSSNYIRFSTGIAEGGVTQTVSAMYFEGILEYSNDPGFSVDDTGHLVYRDEDSAGWVTIDSLAGTGLWEDGTNGVYENDKGVIVGNDIAETLNNSGYTLTIGDMFVADQLGVEGSIFTDSTFNVDKAQDTTFITLNDTTNADTVSIYTGTGTPNGALSAQAGSIFMDQGGAVYVNTDNGTTWTDLAAMASNSGWTDGGTDVNLTTSTDNVGIGGVSLGKLSVDGDTDETQLLIQGNATQTSNLAVFEDSAGTDLVTISGTGVTALTDGTVGAPILTFSGDTNTGIYRVGSDSIGFSAGGVQTLRVGTSGIVTGFLATTDGTAGVPGHSFSNDPDTGMYRSTTNTLGFAGNGANMLTLAPSSATITQAAATSGSPTAFTLTGGAHTGLTASTEDIGVNLNLSATKTWATGAIATQREMLVQAPTYAFAGASTITDAATFAITGAPIAGANATITNPYAFLVDSGSSVFDGDLTVGGSTSRSETLNNAGFTMGGDDLFVAGMAGIEGNIYTDGVILGSSGASGAPTYSFDTDTTTGMYRPSASNLAFTTGGGTRIRIDGTQTNVYGSLFPQGNTTLGDAADDILTANGTWAGVNPFIFEGATANDYETTFAITDPTADNTITFKNETGTVAFLSDIGGGGGWTDGGAVVYNTTAGDAIIIGDTVDHDAKLAVIGDTTTEKGLRVVGAASQADSFILVEKSDGTDIFDLNQYGGIEFKTPGETDSFAIDGGNIDTHNLIRLKSFNEEDDDDPGILNIEHEKSSSLTGDVTGAHVDMITTQANSAYNIIGFETIMNPADTTKTIGLRIQDAVTDIQLADTAAKIAIGNTGTLTFTDGTNTLAAIKDQGDYGFLNIDPKSDTGDPGTCAVGDVYVNSFDGTIKACTVTNTWEALDGGGGATTLDEAYDGGQSITVDASGDLAFNLNSTQDFVIQDAATPFFTFNDDSTLDYDYNGSALSGAIEMIDLDMTHSSVAGAADIGGLTLDMATSASSDGDKDALRIINTTAGTTGVGDDLKGIEMSFGAIDNNGDIYGIEINQPATVGALGSHVDDYIRLSKAGGTINGSFININGGAATDTGLNLGATDIVGTTSDINLTNFDVTGSSGNVVSAGTITSGTNTNVLAASAGSETVFNEQGDNIDFRIEGDLQNYMLHVDADLGNAANAGRLGIGTNARADAFAYVGPSYTMNSSTNNAGTFKIAPNTITNSFGSTVDEYASLWLSAPTTFTQSGTLTNAATIYVQDAPAAATNNYAMLVDDGDSVFDANMVVGGSTSRTETLSNAGFVMGGDDMFIAGMLGVEGNVYTDGSFVAGASLTLSDTGITDSNSDMNFSSTTDGFNFTLGGGADDDFIVDTTTLVVESDNNRVGIGTATPGEKLEVKDGNVLIKPVRADGYITSLMVRSTDSGSEEAAMEVQSTPSGGEMRFFRDNSSVVLLSGVEDSYFNSDGKKLGIGTNSAGGKLEVEVDNSENMVGLLLDMNDSTNNPNGLVINNAGTGYSLLVDEGNAVFDANAIFGGSTSRTETLTNAGFVMGGDDLFVAGMAGIEGGLYSDGAINIEGTAGTVSFEINSNETTAGNNVLMLRSDVAGADDPIFRVQADGAVYADGAYTGTGADYAERFYSVQTDLKPGEIVCVDIAKKNAVRRCESAADGNVMGIVSLKPSIVGNTTDANMKDPHYPIIGLLGQINANVSTENGGIRIGDSLTAASKPGYAMRANAGDPTVGIALEGLANGEGKINVLISRRNKSLSVEQMEDEVSKRIADLELEDEVQLLLSEAMDNLNLDEDMKAIVDSRLSSLDLPSTIETKVASTVDTKISSLNIPGLVQGQIDNLDFDTILQNAGITTTDGQATADDLQNVQTDLHTLMTSVTDLEGLSTQMSTDLADLDTRVAVLEDAMMLNTVDLQGVSSLQVQTLTVAQTAVFEGEIIVKKHVTFNEDTVGQAMVEAGDTVVEVPFEQEYATMPVVTLSMVASPQMFGHGIEYMIIEQTREGFKIGLNKPVEEDILFNWHAFAVEPTKIHLSRDNTGSKDIQTYITLANQNYELPLIEPVSPAADDQPVELAVDPATDPVTDPAADVEEPTPADYGTADVLFEIPATGDAGSTP
ncbi:hypothetical protein KJ951_01165 [Patescibacteria group bacterium]|nr:hypothetical protein [Patescibacteria group bacterium]MBU1702990.1 hypothetical protein [Patescibacteria group bacterium]MBU1953695.1 hypothetical protein [Patescibacteria group bacterium]